ncbi:MAG: NAD(P)H-hydrate dehydratase [Atopobiaceae bacterium]
MQPVLNVEDVRQAEQALVGEGVSLAELMRRAGAATAQQVQQMGDVSHVLVLAGFGNNGGDGWVCAEVLHRKGVSATVVTPLQAGEIKSDLARMVAASAIASGVDVVVAPPRDRLEQMLDASDVVVDAMLGTGFHGEPKAPFDIWIDVLNHSSAQVVSVDVPSGLSAQTGHAPAQSVLADVTVTMLCLKPGLLADDGRDLCGEIIVAPLAEQTERVVVEADPVAWRAEAADYLEVLAPPTLAVDKYTRGSVLVVGGSVRYAGAPIMAARAAARAGAGYVMLAVPEPVVGVAQGHLLEIPVLGMPADPQTGAFSADAREPIQKVAQRCSAVVVGPGMTVNASTMSVVSGLLQCDVPLVIDADALNCIARWTSNRLDSFPELLRRSAPVVLTPHRRELGRLVGLQDTPPDSLTAAMEAARRIVWADGGSEVCVVAKGTATACVGVEAALLPKPGPVALATAGSGDVLSGIMGACLAKTAGQLENDSLPLLCSLACEIHGQAGQIAARKYGSRGVMATDIIDAVGLATDAVEEQASLPDDGPQAEAE